MSTALRDLIRANPDCTQAIAAKDCDAIAAIMSLGKTKPTNLIIGNGTVLDVLGITDGNAFLDFVASYPAFKYVKPLLDQGRLEIGKPLVQATIKSLVPSVLTQINADKLCALGVEPASYSVTEIHAALFDLDGTEK